MERLISVIIKNDINVTKENYKANIYENKIVYNEKNCKMIINLSEYKIIRENKEYLIELNFEPNKITKGIYYLKNQNSKIILEILTDYFIVEKNMIIIKYEIITTKQEVIFKLEYVK